MQVPLFNLHIFFVWLNCYTNIMKNALYGAKITKLCYDVSDKAFVNVFYNF